MGQAKQRGSFEMRRRQAIERNREANNLARINADAERMDAQEPRSRAAGIVIAAALWTALSGTR